MCIRTVAILPIRRIGMHLSSLEIISVMLVVE